MRLSSITADWSGSPRASKSFTKYGAAILCDWHVGNRHTPCQINSDHLLIQADPVIGHMLEHLGAVVEPLTAPFNPEGGAYGHGRTHSHEHVATAHEH